MIKSVLQRCAKYLLICIFDAFDILRLDTDKLIEQLQVRWLKKGRLNRRLFGGEENGSNIILYTEYIPDRYCAKYDVYKKTVNFLDFSDLEKWTKGNFRNNAGDITRFFFLNLCIDYLLEENASGNVVELGVYRGNSAFLLNKFAQKIGAKCYLFDTFEGFDSRDLKGRDEHCNKTDFSDTSFEAVKTFLQGGPNTVFVKGYFPESLKQIDSVGELILVHIDCDLEKPMSDALNYFYPKIKRGGFLIMHDHSSLYWAGAKYAIDEFFKDKPEFIVPIPDKSGSCVVRKT